MSKIIVPYFSSVKCLLLIGLITFSEIALATPVIYDIDPGHTHPSFEIDHFDGLSIWRGNFKKTTGIITFDKLANTGTVHIEIDVASVDFAADDLSIEVAGPKMFDSAKYPIATYNGTLGDFKDGAPTKVSGELTLHGVTKHVDLTIDAFKCMIQPLVKREVCGANALGTFNRADFGVNFGQSLGFKQSVALRIQVEGQKRD